MSHIFSFLPPSPSPMASSGLGHGLGKRTYSSKTQGLPRPHLEDAFFGGYTSDIHQKRAGGPLTVPPPIRSLSSQPRVPDIIPLGPARGPYGKYLTSQLKKEARWDMLAKNAQDRVLEGRQHYSSRLPVMLIPGKTDEDVLRESYRFVRTEEDDDGSWDQEQAKSYDRQLEKRYAIVNLSRAKAKMVGMRWRTKEEAEKGKGRSICGATGCNESEALTSVFTHFDYLEGGKKKSAKVRLRLCAVHAEQLHYVKKHDRKKHDRKNKGKRKKRKKA